MTDSGSKLKQNYLSEFNTEGSQHLPALFKVSITVTSTKLI